MATTATALYTNTKSDWAAKDAGELNAHIDARIDYAGRTAGALPIIVHICPISVEDTAGVDTIATVWVMPTAASGFSEISRAAKTLGGSIEEAWEAVQACPGFIDIDTCGETRVVIVDMVEGGFMPEKALALALHAAGAEHGANIFASASAADPIVLEELGFAKREGTYHLSTYLMENWDGVFDNLPS